MSKQAEFLARIQKAAEDADFDLRELKFYNDMYPKMKILTRSNQDRVEHAIAAVGLKLDKIIEEHSENGKNVFFLVFPRI